MQAPGYAIVGRVRKAHGVRGELVVEPITDAPDEVFASGRRVFAGTVAGDLAPDALELHIVRSRPFKGGWLVVFGEIVGRDEADLWRERYLLAPVDERAPPGDDEVYLHELIGMRVSLASGEPVGEVVELYELPHALMLDVQRDGERVLVPYTPAMVVDIDVGARVIRIDPPAGLLE